MHLEDLLIRYGQGEDLREQIIDNIVGKYRGMGLLKEKHGTSYDGPLWADIDQIVRLAEQRPRSPKPLVRPASAIDCPQAALIDGAGPHSDRCVCSGRGWLVPVMEDRS